MFLVLYVLYIPLNMFGSTAHKLNDWIKIFTSAVSYSCSTIFMP
jgi:hypothetical protein